MLTKPTPKDGYLLAPSAGSPVSWKIAHELVAYPEAVSVMDDRVAAIRQSAVPEQVWLLEHPPLYTAGTSADAADLLDEQRFPVFRSGRGGQYTYHGPGQRVAYVMLDLSRRERDLRKYVRTLEEWMIRVLASFNIRGERRQDRIGVWVPRPELGDGREDKIAAIGVRVRRWVTFHGVSLNVDPVLDHFAGIVPCGVRQHGVTSLTDLGIPVSMPEVDGVMRQTFEDLFGETVRPSDES
ncbi:lipoyl(octanoyl) transferase LipB [Bauldia sp.]|uniref:lipoyl(octanoyl) transferase LipB n=1 Tax=Bauldia sp. TaxID=2575872 RepID=UPI003BAB9A1B